MLPQTMVDSWYCLDQGVPEGMSQVSRRLEVAYINSAPSTPGYLLALLRELSQCPRPLQKLPSRSRYEKWTWRVFGTSSKKVLENRSSRFEPKISWISFSRGSGPPLIEGFHIEDCLICRFYFVPNPSNLVSPVLLCTRSFHTLNRGISFRRIQILLSSFWKRDRVNVCYKCSNSGHHPPLWIMQTYLRAGPPETPLRNLYNCGTKH